MTTVYQIGNNSYVCKDMVFGWCVLHEGCATVIDQMDFEQLDILSEVLPNIQLLAEVRLAIEKRRYELNVAAGKEKLTQELQALKNRELEEEKNRLKRIADERRRVAERMKKSMGVWFGNLTPAQVYEVKNDRDGYVYCRVVPISTGYVLLDDRGVVKGEEKTLSEVVAHILHRWW